MRYRATIFEPYGELAEEFNTIQEAAEWLDSRNNNLERTTMIDTIDDSGRKVDGFFYTRKAG